MEGGAPGDRLGLGAGGRRLGMAPLEEGPQARRGPTPHQGEGVPRRLRRRGSGHGHTARRDEAPARRRAPGAGGRRLPPFRQPRRGALQGRQGPANRDRPRHDAPRRPRPVRRAQRPGRPRDRLPVAPARSGGRDAPGGALRREGAPAVRQGRQGRGAGGGHHRGQAPAHPIPRRPAQAAPPRHTQDAGEGRGQGQRRHRRRRSPRRPGGGAAPAGAGVPHRPGAADRPGRPAEGAGHQPPRHPHLRRPRPHRRLGGARRKGPVGAVGAEDAVDPRADGQDPSRGQRAPRDGRGQPAHHPRRAEAPLRQEVPGRRAQED